MNARECSIRAARDQITHRDVKGSLGACCWSSLSVLYLLFLQSVLYSSTNEACVCRVMIFILNGISGAQLLWSVFISTKQILSYIYFFDYECSKRDIHDGASVFVGLPSGLSVFKCQIGRLAIYVSSAAAVYTLC